MWKPAEFVNVRFLYGAQTDLQYSKCDLTKCLYNKRNASLLSSLFHSLIIWNTGDNKMAKNDFQYGRWNYYTLQCGAIMTLISPGDCTLQCGMRLWNHDSEFTHQVAAPCNVIRGSGMTCR